MHVGQTEIPSLISIGETFVVDAQLVENCGIQVVNVDRVFGDVIAEIVSLTVSHARFDTAAGCPHGEATRMMVASVIFS